MIFKEFGGMTRQMIDSPYKDMLFTIYNMAEDERYTHNLSRFGYDGGMDSLEFSILDRPLGIKCSDFKFYVENELQDGNVVVGVFSLKGKNGGIIPVVIKPKGLDLNEYFKFEEKEEENAAL
jgi:hypothetical protein